MSPCCSYQTSSPSHTPLPTNPVSPCWSYQTLSPSHTPLPSSPVSPSWAYQTLSAHVLTLVLDISQWVLIVTDDQTRRHRLSFSYFSTSLSWDLITSPSHTLYQNSPNHLSFSHSVPELITFLTLDIRPYHLSFSHCVADLITSLSHIPLPHQSSPKWIAQYIITSPSHTPYKT